MYVIKNICNIKLTLFKVIDFCEYQINIAHWCIREKYIRKNGESEIIDIAIKNIFYLFL